MANNPEELEVIELIPGNWLEYYFSFPISFYLSTYFQSLISTLA